MEPLVRFIEDTPIEQIVEDTCRRLSSGTSASELLLASGLAVIRSCDVPSVHHGGSLHPVCGMYAAHHMSRRLSGIRSLLPVVQHVALVNRHIHNLNTGPFILPETQPASINDNVDETLKQLRYHVKHGEYYDCERYFLYLIEHLPLEQVFEKLLNIAVVKNEHDDHQVLLPVYTWRIVQSVGSQFVPSLLRPAIRYVTRPPGPEEAIAADTLIKEFGLDTLEILQHSEEQESPVVAALSQEIGSCSWINDVPQMVAQALARGLSLEGAAEGLSVGASLVLMRSQTADSMGDVHLNTTANARRYLIRQPELSVRLKLRSLLGWSTGPDVRRAGRLLPPGAWCADDPPVAATTQTQHDSLEELRELLCRQPHPSDHARTEHGELLCGDDVWTAVSLAQSYLYAGHDAKALFELLGEIVCRDSSSEFHMYKHHQAMWEEYQSTRVSLASVHLLAAVKVTVKAQRPDDTDFSVAMRALVH